MRNYPGFISPITFDGDRSALAAGTSFDPRAETTVEECVERHAQDTAQAAYCDRLVADSTAHYATLRALERQRKTLDV